MPLRGYFTCSISFRARTGFWLYNCMSKNIFMLPLYLIDTLVDHRLLVWQSISLRILKALLHFLHLIMLLNSLVFFWISHYVYKILFLEALESSVSDNLKFQDGVPQCGHFSLTELDNLTCGRQWPLWSVFLGLYLIMFPSLFSLFSSCNAYY